MILTGIPIFELSSVSLGITLIIISIFLFLSDFYMEQYLIPKLGRKPTLRYGTLGIIVSVPVISLLWIKMTRMISNYSIWFGIEVDNIEDEDGEHLLSSEIIFCYCIIYFCNKSFLQSYETTKKFSTR